MAETQTPRTALQEAVHNQNEAARKAAVARIEGELVILRSLNDDAARIKKRQDEIRANIEKIASEVPATVEQLLGKAV